MLAALAVLFVFAALVLEGVTAAAVPVVLGVMLVLPGDLIRRAVLPRRPFSTMETLAVDFALSCTVLTVGGGLLAAVGGLSRGWLVVSSVLAAAAVVGVARRRGDEASAVSTTVQAFSVVVVLAGMSVCLFHVEPQIGDRIFLGQLRTAVEVMRAGRIPATTWTFGAETPFPVNYLFYDIIISTTALIGGFERWSELKLLAAGLRLTQLGLFGIVWYLVGRELLRRFRADALTKLCAAALPLILLLNAGLVAKFREPLVEGFGIILLGVAVWAIAQSTAIGRSDRTWWFVLSVLSTTLLVGVHFPVFVQAVVLIGAWLLVALPARTPEGPDPRLRRLLGRRVQAVALPAGIFLAAAVGALLVMGVLGPGSPVGLATGEVSQETVFRAYKFYVGDPLTTRTLADFISGRWSTGFLLTSGAFVRPALLLGVPSVVGLGWVLLHRGGRRRILGWLLLAAGFNLAYLGVGLSLGRTTLTPWNAVTRNGFYVWFPIALGITLGLRATLSVLERRAAEPLLRARSRQLARVAAIVAISVTLVVPFVDTYGPAVRDYGWIAPPRITADGERALAWVGRETPQDSVILTTEDTFGSSLIADRRIVTEGFATVESGAVTAAAVATLSSATDFLLPAHSPAVLLEHRVDFVVSRAGVYQPAVLGGLPLLGAYWNRLETVLPELLLDSIPYLERAQVFGDVTVYRVHRDRIPSMSVTHVGVGEQSPACTAEVCFVYRTISDGNCAPAETSTERHVCIERLGPAAG